MKSGHAITRIISAFLIMAMTAAAVSCAESAEKIEETPSVTAAQTEEAETEEERDTRFDGVNFDGKEFRVFTSINTYDATNANALIEGTG